MNESGISIVKELLTIGLLAGYVGTNMSERVAAHRGRLLFGYFFFGEARKSD